MNRFRNRFRKRFRRFRFSFLVSILAALLPGTAMAGFDCTGKAEDQFTAVCHDAEIMQLSRAVDASFARGDYAGSVEELTPVAGDPIAAVPVVAAFVASLSHPPLWRKFHAGAVGPYAVTPEAWKEILAAAE